MQATPLGIQRYNWETIENMNQFTNIIDYNTKENEHEQLLNDMIT